MAEVTVKQLANDVGTSPEKLLNQMEAAGLSKRTLADSVSDEEKQKLLSFLKQSHGEDVGEPKKITLKRKTTTTLRASGQRTVNVEVRKKRTYIKRSEVAVDAEGDARKAAEEKAQEVAVEAQAAEQVELAAEQKTDAPAAEPVAETVAETETAEAADKAVEGSVNEEAKDGSGEAGPVVDPAAIEAAESGKGRKDDGKKSKHRKHKDEEREAVDDDEVKLEKKRAEKGKVKAEPKPVKRVADVAATEEEDETIYAPKTLRTRHKKRKARSPAPRQANQPIIREVLIPESITVSELAQRMSVKAAEVVKKLMGMGVMATVNQSIEQDVAQLVVEEMGHKVVLHQEDAVETRALESFDYSSADQETRAPVVTVMGHVDHGKTSLLDHIRRTRVAAGESGGITQHIGAYHVDTDKGMITFLDTPGHAAFTAMRARGAQSTDVVILVVAADDGVMPQTREAVEHARSAGVPLVVAVNKIDKPEADPDRVRNELTALEVIPEEWGGDVQFVNVSAHSGEGIDNLLESVLLQAELLELTAVRNAPGKGVVVESSLDKARGSVATLLVQNGTLRQGDIVLGGEFYGRVRAMLDETGKPLKEAGPSIPVEILGLNGAPEAGDEFQVLPDEKTAREVAEFRKEKQREARLQRQGGGPSSLESLFQNMGKGEVRELNLVLKTDVRGSLEALSAALMDLGNDEVQVKIVSSGVGGITETDANLAVSTSAIVIGFNVRADGAARKVIEREGIELRYYSIIYNVIDDVKNALVGLLAPEYREDIVGTAEVRDTFKSPKFGQVAGCMVLEGNVYRNKPIRVLRDNVVIFEGELESLRRFKDDVSEVRAGTECGIGVRNYEVKVGDLIEVFDRVRVERTL